MPCNRNTQKDDKMKLEEIEGKTIKSIEGLEHGSHEVNISFTDGTYMVQYHDQSCCEWVRVEQVDGNIEKHIDATVIALKESIVYGDDFPESEKPEYTGSLTATFYTLVTSKGYLDWRWYGESNGHYSESVDIKFGASE